MKLKTHSGAKKRVKVTGKGKLMMQKAHKRHLMINKSKRQKKLETSGHALHKTDEYRIRSLLPYA